jgi:ATP:corrinoid adenosyltransferase
VGNGNRTRNRRSHSPVLCQLSYSHRKLLIIATGVRRRQRSMSEIADFVARLLEKLGQYSNGFKVRV